MSELLLKIYEKVVSDEEVAYKMRLRIDEWVEERIKDCSEKLSVKDIEKLRDIIYAATLKAEQEGFQLGIQFVIRLIKELYTNL